MGQSPLLIALFTEKTTKTTDYPARPLAATKCEKRISKYNFAAEDTEKKGSSERTTDQTANEREWTLIKKPIGVY